MLAATGSLSAGTAPDPEPLTELPAGVSIVVDGNSISAGSLSGPLDQLLIEALGDAANGAAAQNVALGGQTWLDMLANHADVDSRWNESADHNVLVVAEDSNAAFNVGERTAAQIVADTYGYLNAVRSANPGWKIVMWGNLPRAGGEGDLAQHNADLITVNDYWRTNWRAAGLRAWVDVRDGIPQYDHDGSLDSYFTDYQSAWYETSAWIHPLAGSYLENTGVRAIVAKIRNAMLAMSWS